MPGTDPTIFFLLCADFCFCGYLRVPVFIGMPSCGRNYPAKNMQKMEHK